MIMDLDLAMKCLELAGSERDPVQYEGREIDASNLLAFRDGSDYAVDIRVGFCGRQGWKYRSNLRRMVMDRLGLE